MRTLIAMLVMVGAACGDGDRGSGKGMDAAIAGSGAPVTQQPVWSACFTPPDGIETCDAYCASQGTHCETSCETGSATTSNHEASALAWNGPVCNCSGPRCDAVGLAYGWGDACGAIGFTTLGGEYVLGSARCCCAPGEVEVPTPMCDSLGPGVWITGPEPSPTCGADGNGDHEELNFVDTEMLGVGPHAVRWVCTFAGFAPRSASVYELQPDGCSGLIFGSFFTVDGDVLTAHWSEGPREYHHMPDAMKRAGDPLLGL